MSNMLGLSLVSKHLVCVQTLDDFSLDFIY